MAGAIGAVVAGAVLVPVVVVAERDAPAGTPTLVLAGATLGALVAVLTVVLLVVVGCAVGPVLADVAAGLADVCVDWTKVMGARSALRAVSAATALRDFSIACAGKCLAVPVSCPNEAEARIRIAAHPPMNRLVEVDIMNFAKG